MDILKRNRVIETNNYRIYSNLPDMPAPKVWAEIDTSAIVANYKMLTANVEDGVAKFSVVKADAYGHGADKVVRALLAAGCRHFAVSCIEEAIEIRNTCESENTDALILILGYTPAEEASYLSKYRITQAVLSLGYAEELSSYAEKDGFTVKCHIAIDSGMNRIGFTVHSEKEISESFNQIKQVFALPGISVCGMFTHFAQADDPEDCVFLPDSKTRIQNQRFLTLADKLKTAGYDVGLCHVCNSAGAVRFEEMHLNGIRLGIMLYGYPASSFMNMPELKPAMHLKTVITHIHIAIKGEKVGYGGTFTAEKPTVIATLPIGYADGFTRNYAGSKVYIHTQNGIRPANIVGRICMDQCMVDVTGIDCKRGDTVTLFGDAQSRLSELAANGKTIEYETLCAISARVPRIYVTNERK